MIIIAGAALAPRSARADVIYWQGNIGPYWSDSGNWSESPTANYGTLQFQGTPNNRTSINNAVTSQNALFFADNSWTLNSDGTVLGLHEYGQYNLQAKIESQSSGAITLNLPVSFVATSGPNWGEINSSKGPLTFGGGVLAVTGSAVNGIRMYGTGQATTFNNTVSASGKYFATTGDSQIVNIGGQFTASNFYVMNAASLNLSVNNSSLLAIRLGGDFGTTGAEKTSEGATFNLTPTSGGITFAGTLNSVSENTTNGPTTLTIASQNTSGTNTLSGHIALDHNLTITQAAGGTLNLTQARANSTDTTTGTDLKGNTLTIGGDGPINHSGTIYNSTGSGSLVKIGAGTLTLGGPNTYSGNTTISAGAISVVDGGALGSGGVTVASAASLNFANASAMTVGNAINSGATSAAGTLNASGVGTLTLTGGTSGSPNTIAAFAQTSGTVNLGGVLNVGSAQAVGNKLSVNGGGILNFGGIAGATIAATATDVVQSVNIGEVSAGSLNVNNGSLSVTTGTASATGINGNGVFIGGSAGGATGNVTVSGGVMTVNGPIYVGAGTNGSNGQAAGTLTLNGGLFTTGTVTTTTTNGNTTTPTGYVFVLGSAHSDGTINLDAGGTLATALTISPGTPGGVSTFNFNGGTLQANATASLLSGLSAANVRAGGIVLNPNGFNVTLAQTLSHGDAPVDGGLKLIGSAGTVTLSVANTFNGPTTIANGIELDLADTNALQSSTLNVNTGGGAAHFMKSTITLGGLAGTLGVSLTNSTSATLALSVGNNNASTSYSGALSGVGGSLTKVGTGTLTLGGTNTYTGNTTVNGGTLNVTGSITDPTPRSTGTYTPGAVTVASGGTLIGTGTINETVAVSGTISAGTSAARGGAAGALATAGQTWNGGGTYAVKFVGSAHAGGTAAVAGTDFDTINMTGLLNLSAATASNPFNIVLTKAAGGTFATPTVGTQYKIVYASQGISRDTSLTNEYAAGTKLTGLFALNTDDIGLASSAFSVVVGSDGYGQDLLLEFDGGGGGAATPEPGTVALCGAGGATLLGQRRRTRDRRGGPAVFRI